MTSHHVVRSNHIIIGEFQALGSSVCMDSSSRLMNDDVLLDIRDDPQPPSSISSSATAGAAGADTFLQHEDTDVVIPDHLCWPLLISSHLLLVTAIVAAVYQYWVLFGVNMFVYLTSILHWRAPR